MDRDDEVVTPAAAAPVPSMVALSASPNPFNPSTTLSYDLPSAGQVEVTVFNAVGQRVATLVSGYRDSGTHQLTWDASGLPSGLYFARIQAVGANSVQKLLLTK
jgi:flagellar hook assembly protein FlgD